MAIKGTLIPIGGNEDKGNEKDKNEKYTLEYIQEGILSRVVKESGGKDAKIIIIPTASSIPIEVSEIYLEAFGKLGCTDLEVFDIRSKEDADKPEFLKLMTEADCVMFSGGDQSRIVEHISGTILESIIKDSYRNKDFVLAGTSAGAMCMSEEMIAGGGYEEVFIKGAVRMGKGMGFNPKLIIDSHFIQRRRFGRLTEAVAKFPHLIGIGLAEDTGLVIKNGRDCEVIGSGMMVLLDARNLTHNNESVLKDGAPMSITNLKTHILASGDTIKLGKEFKIAISNPAKQKKETIS